MPSKNTSIKLALKQAAERLRKAGIDSAWLDAELLFAHVLNINRSYLLSSDELSLSRVQEKKFKSLIAQRAKFVPIAYLLGHKEFYGLDFKVTKDTLVPRPESELMVEEALKNIDTKTTLIDIGTGSGCLLISVLKHSKITGIGLDLSSKALAIAKANTKTHGLVKRIIFKKSDLLSNIKIEPNKNLLILANLPYLTKSQMKEKTISREPKLALYGGVDGLLYYGKLAKQLKRLPNSYTLLAEINPGQKNSFKKIFPKAEFRKDLSGKIRLAIVR